MECVVPGASGGITDKATTAVAERDLTIDGARDAIPLTLWTAHDACRPRALLLLGHGGSQHKRSSNIALLAHRAVTHHGCAAAAIDLPGHGGRMPADEREMGIRGRQRALRDRMQAPGGHQHAVREAVADWTVAIDHLQQLDGLADCPIGYWGLSMGTRFGIPLVASDPRIRAAVLGLFVWTPIPMLDGYDEFARAVNVPVMFLVQWDDELARRDLALDLFDLIGSPRKTLHANPGRHLDVPGREGRASLAYLAEHLLGPDDDAPLYPS